MYNQPRTELIVVSVPTDKPKSTIIPPETVIRITTPPDEVP